MSYNILELIKNSDIEWKTLGEICDLKRGRVISKKYLEENFGDYPVYSSQTSNNGTIGTINSFDFDGEYVTWTTDGAYAGTVFYRNGKFSITNICGLITIKSEYLKPKPQISYKFLFYWLQIEAKKHISGGMGNPKLMSNVIEKVLIPIPPLAVQGEIVRILDNFTELTARKKQYDYYLNKLLTFENTQDSFKILGGGN